MKKISIYALVISILWSATSSSAQTVIQGFIYDKKKHTPIGSASIRINTLNISTISDKYGYFILSLDPKHSITDKLSLQVSHISYKNITYVWEKLDDTLFIYLDSKIHQLPEVIVQSLYINDDSPFPYTQYSNQEIKQKNIVSDIPFIIGDSPSVTKTSDSGTGIGYTSLRIRGIDAGRINITLNDVPLNDAESQIVYWVNLPDLASSLETIQIQRGISTSGNGGSSFGGSLHLNTVLPPDNPKAEIALTYGSFDTRKFRLNISTGNIGQWAFNGKFSIIKSDGYIDRSFSDLSSYHFTISYKNTRHILKMEVISGKEQTYQAWNGVPEPIIKNNSEQLENYISSLYINEEHAQHHRNNIGSRTFNPFVYENQTDNYRQDHYLSQYQHTLNKNLLLQGTLHYTYGRGFYEEYQTEQDLYTYNLHPVSNENYSSLIRQLWLRNHYYGSVTTLSWIEQKHNIKSGIGLHFYHGDHYGNVIETPQLKKLDHQYYFNDAFKQNMYGYIKSIWKPSKKWNLYSDFKYRYIYYNFSGKDIQHTTEDAQQITDVQQKTNYHFFTPKFGITFYPIPNIRTYTSFSWGYKEPTRNELISSTHNSRPQPEKLFDIEIGFDWNNENISTSVNGYYMDYKNQLITTGEINDVGLYIRQNIPKSKRTGIGNDSNNPISKTIHLAIKCNPQLKYHRRLQLLLR